MDTFPLSIVLKLQQLIFLDKKTNEIGSHFDTNAKTNFVNKAASAPLLWLFTISIRTKITSKHSFSLHFKESKIFKTHSLNSSFYPLRDSNFAHSTRSGSQVKGTGYSVSQPLRPPALWPCLPPLSVCLSEPRFPSPWASRQTEAFQHPLEPTVKEN